MLRHIFSFPHLPPSLGKDDILAVLPEGTFDFRMDPPGYVSVREGTRTYRVRPFGADLVEVSDPPLVADLSADRDGRNLVAALARKPWCPATLACLTDRIRDLDLDGDDLDGKRMEWWLQFWYKRRAGLANRRAVKKVLRRWRAYLLAAFWTNTLV